MASESDNDDLHDEIKIVTIRIFSSHEIAQLAASNLEAHDIQCWITSDDGGGVMPYLTAPGGVRLSVRVSDVEAATSLLNTKASLTEILESEVQATAPSLPEQTSKIKFAPIQFFLGIGLGIFLCLLCQPAEKSGTKYYYNYTSDGKCYEAFTYENGHLVEAVRDRNLDGKWDAWIYYQSGHILRAEYDNNFDGKPDEWVTYSNASPVTAEKDNDFNGIPDEFVTYTNGMIEQMEIKPNGSTFATQRWIYKNDVLVEILRGGDSKGNFKEDEHFDPFFNPNLINIHRISTNIPTTFQLLSPSSK